MYAQDNPFKRTEAVGGISSRGNNNNRTDCYRMNNILVVGVNNTVRVTKRTSCLVYSKCLKIHQNYWQKIRQRGVAFKL